MIEITSPDLKEAMTTLLRAEHGFEVMSTVVLDQLARQVPPGIFEAIRLGVRDTDIPELLAKVWSDPNDPSGQLQFFSKKDPGQMKAELLTSMFLRKVSYRSWHIMTTNMRLAQLFQRLDQGVTIPISRRLRWFMAKNQPGLVSDATSTVVFQPRWIVRRSLKTYEALVWARVYRAVWRSFQLLFPGVH